MVNVFSFCLYGPYNPKYYIGLKENIQIINSQFPDFEIYITCGSDIDENKFNEIMENFKPIFDKISILKYNITGPILMLLRFFPIDYENVDCLFSRDNDSRIGERDIWCINKFLSSSFILHTIRDHSGHFVKMLGGLSGIKKDILKHIGTPFSKYVPFNINVDYNYDQVVLELIYNKFKHLLLVHSTKNIYLDNYENIPLEVNKENFCGQVIDYDKDEKPFYVFDYKSYDNDTISKGITMYNFVSKGIVTNDMLTKDNILKNIVTQDIVTQDIENIDNENENIDNENENIENENIDNENIDINISNNENVNININNNIINIKINNKNINIINYEKLKLNININKKSS